MSSGLFTVTGSDESSSSPPGPYTCIRKVGAPGLSWGRPIAWIRRPPAPSDCDAMWGSWPSTCTQAGTEMGPAVDYRGSPRFPVPLTTTPADPPVARRPPNICPTPACRRRVNSNLTPWGRPSGAAPFWCLRSRETRSISSCLRWRCVAAI